jgi:hypothetical protein
MHSLSSIHTSQHALILLPKLHIFGIWVRTWLVMMLSLARVVVESFGLPSVVTRGDRGEGR